MRVDAHQHFWRYNADAYPWMSDAMEVLRRDYLPEDLRPLLDARHVDKCIAVQARASEDETAFLLELSERHDWIAAVIGWLDLRSTDFEARLAAFRNRSKFAGLRHQLQDERDPADFLNNPYFTRSVGRLQRQKLIYEVLVFAHQIVLVDDFCARFDEHWLVLDHLGKPSIRAHDRLSWRTRLATLASRPHVVCKLSGLVTEATDTAGRFDEGEIVGYLDTALELFGAERLMFGSDWPVCLLAAPYIRVADIVERWSEQLTVLERGAIWGGTAQRIYALAPASE
jgi:L-fuconolactonase